LIAGKLKIRDKALDNFKHYYEKTRKLNEDKQLRMKIANPDPVKEAREVELIARVSMVIYL
jgi:hypothetical protein